MFRHSWELRRSRLGAGGGEKFLLMKFGQFLPQFFLKFSFFGFGGGERTPHILPPHKTATDRGIIVSSNAISKLCAQIVCVWVSSRSVGEFGRTLSRDPICPLIIVRVQAGHFIIKQNFGRNCKKYFHYTLMANMLTLMEKLNFTPIPPMHYE